MGAINLGQINFVVFLIKSFPQMILNHYAIRNKLLIANPSFLTTMTNNNNNLVIADRTTTIGQYFVVL